MTGVKLRMKTSSTSMHNLLGSFNIRFIALFFVLQLFTACSQKQPAPQTDEPASENVQQQKAPVTEEKAIDTEMYQQGLDALALNDFSSARNIFQQFIKENPTLSGAYTNLALIDYKQEKYDQAFKLIEIALSINPQQAAAFHLRAQLYLQQGKIKRARDDYLMALKLKPDYINAHYNLALLYDIYLQEIALAVEHYNKYLSLITEKDSATREWVNHLKNTLKNG
jgi:tetratricopeptide (TPR) repeat protein